MGVKYIHLVRHGQYHMDREKDNYGSLTSLGKRQAKYAAKRLADHDISVFHSSTMIRAKETAEVITEVLGEKKARASSLLVEGVPCFPPKLLKKTGVKKSKLSKTKKRMDQAYKKFFTPFKRKGEKHEALICHGNLIRYLIVKSLGIENEKWVSFDILQCSLSTIVIHEDGRKQLICYGEIGHVPMSKRTFL